MIYTVFYAESLRDAPRSAPAEVELIDYRKVARVTAPSLGDVFREMNAVDGTELCCKLGVRSMSVGDIAVDENGVAHYVESVGWGTTQFC